MPRSESFGAFVFLRDKLRLAFAVISVPLRRDWCRVLCAVCRVRRRTAFAGFCVLSLSFLLVLVYICVHGLSVVVRLGIQKKSFCWALAVLEVHLQGIMLTFECHNERNCVCEIKQFGSV